MTITWLGRSCFKITHNNYSIVIDPYRPCPSNGYKKFEATANKVLVSHNHQSHNYVQGVKIENTSVECPFKIETIEVAHDYIKGAMRGMNLVHILTTEDGYKLVHLGDTGEMFEDERMNNPDVLMTNAGSLTALPSYECYVMAQQINPNVVIPMHMHHAPYGNRRYLGVNDLLELYDDTIEAKYYEGNTIEITKDTPRHFAVLKYIPIK